METISEIVRRAEHNYINGTTKLGDFVDWSMHDTIERIIAYINSKHISGDKDSLRRDKPFFNIITAAINIWYRATDIDRKNMNMRPTKGTSTMLAFLATVILKDWMRKSNFGVFLNDWGRTLSQYGSAVVKFIKKDGKLIPSVVSWNRIICDPIDFDSLPRIEKIYKTPAQLQQMKELDQAEVKSLIDSLTTRRTLDGSAVDNLGEFIELFEVHGELPKALLADDPQGAPDADWTKYVQQMHIVSYQVDQNKKYTDYSLFKGREEKDPYLKTDLIKEDGRTLSIGAVEYLFDAQWMVNHSVKSMKDTLDLTSKILFQTSDTNFMGRNVLTAVETGDILTHAQNEPLTQINNSKSDITAVQNFSDQWRVLGQEITATPDSTRGVNPPSGTPFSTTALLTQQSNSLFEIMTESKSLSLEEMMRIHILPFIKTKLDNKDEVVAILEDHQIKQIDSAYVPKKAIKEYNKREKEKVLNGEPALPFDPAQEESVIQQGLSTLGNRRAFAPGEIIPGDKTWKEVLKDFEWEFEMLISDEAVDINSALQTLTGLIQSVDPQSIQDPYIKLMLSKVLSLTGNVNPIELPTGQASPQAAPQPEALTDLAQ